jgi:hypothetical protein
MLKFGSRETFGQSNLIRVRQVLRVPFAGP